MFDVLSAKACESVRQLWSRRYQCTLVVLLLGVVTWGQVVSDPKLLVDLSGQWDACPLPDDGTASCNWRQVRVPAHFVAAAEDNFGHYVKFRRTFEAPGECFEHTCKLLFSEVGDSAAVRVNGFLLRLASPPGRPPVYQKNFPVGVNLPPALLRADERNDLEVTVHSFKDRQVGLRAGPIGITTNTEGNAFLQWRSFRNVFLPLACAIVGAVIMFLVGFFPQKGVAPSRWLAFYKYATVSTLFTFSFTEMPRHFLPLTFAIPGHFILRFLSDFTLFRLLCIQGGVQHWGVQLAHRVYQTCLAAFAALLCIGTASDTFGWGALEPI